MRDGRNLRENLRAFPFNKQLLHETTFSLIHLAGHYSTFKLTYMST
jgi:hypothetical protein